MSTIENLRNSITFPTLSSSGSVLSNGLTNVTSLATLLSPSKTSDLTQATGSADIISSTGVVGFEVSSVSSNVVATIGAQPPVTGPQSAAAVISTISSPIGLGPVTSAPSQSPVLDNINNANVAGNPGLSTISSRSLLNNGETDIIADSIIMPTATSRQGVLSSAASNTMLTASTSLPTGTTLQDLLASIASGANSIIQSLSTTAVVSISTSLPGFINGVNAIASPPLPSITVLVSPSFSQSIFTSAAPATASTTPTATNNVLSPSATPLQGVLSSAESIPTPAASTTPSTSGLLQGLLSSIASNANSIAQILPAAAVTSIPVSDLDSDPKLQQRCQFGGRGSFGFQYISCFYNVCCFISKSPGHNCEPRKL
jgi:hypothetical protein